MQGGAARGRVNGNRFNIFLPRQSSRRDDRFVNRMKWRIMNCRRKRSFFLSDFAAEAARLRGRTGAMKNEEILIISRSGFAASRRMLLLLITERDSFPYEYKWRRREETSFSISRRLVERLELCRDRHPPQPSNLYSLKCNLSLHIFTSNVFIRHVYLIDLLIRLYIFTL